MNLKSKLLPCFFLLFCFMAYGQMGQFEYVRTLPDEKEEWHRIVLPTELFGQLSNKFSDIRIYGITAEQDTIEAPYILKPLLEKKDLNEVAFDLINQSENGNGYHFIYEIPSETAINLIYLNFNKESYDYRIKLEGSNDQKEWFTLTDNYRIVKIRNKSIHHEYNKITFPKSKYRYFRLQFDSKKNPGLIAAKSGLSELTEGTYIDYPIKYMQTIEMEKAKLTKVEFELGAAVPISKIKFNISDTTDYFRRVEVKYLADSVQNFGGLNYKYETIGGGVLSTLEKNEFPLRPNLVQKMRAIIINQDNSPLTIRSIEVQGPVVELITRFTKPASYYLVYGNKYIDKPQYDINRNLGIIPKDLNALTLGDEQKMDEMLAQRKNLLSRNKTWMWVAAGFVLLLLVWFYFNKMKGN